MWQYNLRMSMRFTVVVLVLAGTNVTAETEIHRCMLEDGTIAYQETPCPETDKDGNGDAEAGESGSVEDDITTTDDAFDFVNPFDEPANPPTPSEPELPEPASQDRAECEKTTRDAIDAIDLEMRGNDDTQQQGRQYLDELLALTAQLRACKQL